MTLFRSLGIVSLLGLSSLAASTLEYPTLYKDTRIMGMGGANIALGGEASSIFHNPAGLSSMEPSEGVEFDIMRMTANISSSTIPFVLEIMSATDTFAVVENHIGENNHLTLNDYTSLSYRGEKYAFSFGILAHTDLNFIAHQGFGSTGVIELNGYAAAVLVSGLSYDITDNFHLGLGYKALLGYGVASNVSLTGLLDIMGGDMSILNGLYTQFSAMTYDAGLIYDMHDFFPYGELLQPSIGLSVENIGGAVLGPFGTIPTTYNIGLAFRPDIPFLDEWAFAIDYIDVTNAHYADYNGDGFIDYDRDIFKRLRLGGRASLYHNFWMQLTASLGLYNAVLAAGIEYRLLFMTIEASTYAEEIGAYVGQNLDRRYQLTLNIGF